MQFSKATKKQSKLRAALFGPSGSGKTMSALRIAKGIGGKIAVIDTETGSASKYSDRFDFDVVDLPDPKISAYTEAINLADENGYNVLIIDSLSHAWQQLLEKVEQLAQKKYKNNSWSAWSEGTPVQRKFVKAILGFSGHVIATMRSKTEWVTEKDSNNKNRPVRIGLAPEQGKGIEYEFDILLELNQETACQVLKDRTGKFQGKFIELIDEKFGKELLDWLSEGQKAAQEPYKVKITGEPKTPTTPSPGAIPDPSRPSPDFGDEPEAKPEAKKAPVISAAQLRRLHTVATAEERTKEDCYKIIAEYGYESSKDVLVKDYDKIIADLENPLLP